MSAVPAVVDMRVDATSRIGAGHAMRCLSVARELMRRSAEAVFFVSCAESASFFAEEGFECHVLPGDEVDLSADDAIALGEACRRRGISCVLVDSYAADGGFFDAVKTGALNGLGVAYVDDMYSVGLGILDAPVRRPVDMVVNCNFFADAGSYGEVYRDDGTMLLIGPQFAPLRGEFVDSRPASCGSEVTDILLTTGSTNPSGILERLSGLCLAAAPEALVHVVVGPKAEYEPADSENLVLHKGESMAGLMRSCQMAVSAAGVTLLELAAMGVPAVAVGVVDNQHQDIAIYEGGGFGLGCFASDDDAAIKATIARLYQDSILRGGFSRKCRETVDGKGSGRIAKALLDIARRQR